MHNAIRCACTDVPDVYMCACTDALDDALQDSIAVVRHALRSGSWRHALAASDVIAAMQALQAQLTLAFDTQRLAAANEVSLSYSACVCLRPRVQPSVVDVCLLYACSAVTQQQDRQSTVLQAPTNDGCNPALVATRQQVLPVQRHELHAKSALNDEQEQPLAIHL